MGLLKKIVNAKNVVKVGSFVASEMKKNTEEVEKECNQFDNINNLCAYAKKNAELFINVIEKLKDETKNLIKEVRNSEILRLTWKEKSKINGIRYQAEENLKYLYLSKEYLNLVNKNLSGVVFTEMQNIFIFRFSGFFDGRKVLDDDYNEYEEDYSLLGDVKEMLNDFKEGIIGSKKKKEFDFDDILYPYYRDIRELKIPDFNETYRVFFPAYISSEKDRLTIKCNDCLHEVPLDSKFGPSCGSVINANAPLFCPYCGEKLRSDAKFCHKCGKKVY